ncbi:MAG: hypothetical protein HRT44_01020 [Bdellovibrionales bacterium]|nr:hypothetical protein [Bdellovibrionales bacterium]NQZ17832.1 hypothetical protein [Bdellovibrionales bacterium]
MHKLIPLIVSLLMLTNCATQQVGSGEKTDVGIWQGKVMMTNKNNKNRKWAYVTWVSDSPNQRMRIDVRAILDTPVATYIRDESGAHLWLYLDGKYFFSKDAEKLFSQLVKFSFDPDNFFSFLGNPKKLGEPWSCTNKDDLYTCLSPKQKTNVSINHSENDKRVIKVEKGAKGLRVRLSRAKVQVGPQLFRKPSTTHFETIEI